jgi:23S rRNA (cytidine1920-2'-O)/16S rRNA (cytidine1409-2'-O)-methyltransferase
MAPRKGLSVVMVTRALAPSLEAAEALIGAGRVLVNGACAMSGAHQVANRDSILITDRDRFVSRGGQKLQAAIDHFGIDFAGKYVLDAGSSTGGFTDCALQAGAAHVTALDVGRSLLHERIAGDRRVLVVDEFNVRKLADRNANPAIRDLYDIVVADLSFISLIAVADALCSRVAVGGVLVLLVKPQFEAEKTEVDKGAGVITDPIVHQRTCDKVTVAYQARGCELLGVMPSPIRGASGNTEFLLYLRRGASS